MSQGFSCRLSVNWIRDYELADEIMKQGESVTVSILRHHHWQETKLRRGVDRLVLLEWLVPCTEVVHDTAEGPTVDVGVTAMLLPCLWGTPLLDSSASVDLAHFGVKLLCHIEVNNFHPDWLEGAALFSQAKLLVFEVFILLQAIA